MIRDVCGSSNLELHEPVIGATEKKCVNDCLDSGFVSSIGQYVSFFEDTLKQYTKCDHAAAVVNGTAALHLSFTAVGVSANQEVILSPLSFVAPANAIKYCGATPHFVDVEETTLSISSQKLDERLHEIGEVRDGKCYNTITGRQIVAILLVYVFGHPPDLEKLIDVARKWKLLVIEDASEALGTIHKGKHAGSFGDVGVLSFNGNKIITTGGGGAVLTDDEGISRKVSHLSTTAKTPHQWRYFHDQIGYNYRMPNINAALGYAQLEKLELFIEANRKLYSRYQKAAMGNDLFTIFEEPLHSRSNYWLQAVMLTDSVVGERDNILNYLHEKNIRVRPVWDLLSSLPAFEQDPSGDLSTAKKLVEKIINLPSSSNL